MATLTTADVADLVLASLPHLGRGKWSDISAKLQNYHAMRRILTDKKVTMGGTSLQWQVAVRNGGNARRVGLHGTDTMNIVDGMVQASAPWRHNTTNWTVDRREMAMNSTSDEQVFELLRFRKFMSMMSLAELLEEDFWTSPSSSSETLRPYGVPYYVVQSTNEGFNGTVPTGHTSVAGISPTTYPAWANWTNGYTNVSRTDLVRKMRSAAKKTKFEPPVPFPEYNQGDSRGVFANEQTLTLLEEIAEDQNENLGSTLGSMDGTVMFQRRPIEYISYLDGTYADASTHPDTAFATDDPVYGIDFSQFFPVFLPGEYMHDNPPIIPANQHWEVVVNVDNSYNFACTNRRTNWVITKS